MNFTEDLKREIKKYFDSWEITYTIPSDEHSALIDFYNTNLKLIPQMSRTVYKSDEVLNKSLSQPYSNALAYIENKFINGGDINPHLSKLSLNPSFDDKLLSDWSVYHIHISDSKKTPTQTFYDRSDFLLFAIVINVNVYFIDIRPHYENIVFSKKEFLEIIQRNWIHILEPLELKGVIGLSHNCTDEEIEKLRKAGVNTLHEVNGKVYGSPGYGYTSNGKSIQCVLSANNTIKWIKYAEKYITEHGDELKEAIRNATGVTVTNPEYELIIIDRNPGFVIKEKTTGCYCA